MGRPQILVLDEPTNELNPHKRRLVLDTIANLNREQSATRVLVTHNVLEAERVVQQMAVMHSWRIVALGTPGELKMQAGGKVRLEFTIKEGAIVEPSDILRLKILSKVEQPTPDQYRLYIEPHQTAEIDQIRQSKTEQGSNSNPVKLSRRILRVLADNLGRSPTDWHHSTRTWRDGRVALSGRYRTRRQNYQADNATHAAAATRDPI